MPRMPFSRGRAAAAAASQPPAALCRLVSGRSGSEEGCFGSPSGKGKDRNVDGGGRREKTDDGEAWRSPLWDVVVVVVQDRRSSQCRDAIEVMRPTVGQRLPSQLLSHPCSLVLHFTPSLPCSLLCSPAVWRCWALCRDPSLRRASTGCPPRPAPSRNERKDARTFVPIPSRAVSWSRIRRHACPSRVESSRGAERLNGVGVEGVASGKRRFAGRGGLSRSGEAANGCRCVELVNWVLSDRGLLPATVTTRPLDLSTLR